MTERITATTWDAVARVCAGITGFKYVYGAGVTDATSKLVVPQADDFADSGVPAVVVGLGPWTAITGGGQTRRRYEFRISLWFGRNELGERIPEMADAIDQVIKAFEQHTEAYLIAEQPTWSLQSALITGGSAIEQRSIGSEQPRPYLVAPMTAEVVVDVSTNPQPA